MRILIVGSGGREHALAWKLAQSPLADKIFIAPGNGGTAEVGENVPITDGDIPALVNFAKEKNIELVVVGPELPLVLGLKDVLAQEGIACFGPNAYAAQLEGSKAFSKTVMRHTGIPTADFVIFDEYSEAFLHVEKRSMPCVIKADGLAAGKGVVLVKTKEEAQKALYQMMVKKVFGKAGESVVIEDALVGEEASFLAFVDGKNIKIMPSSQDHKAVYEGDKGPNTGGMGAYSPARILPKEDYEALAKLTIEPIVKYMAQRDRAFTGILYAGLMFTKNGPQVLEYNVRFGDPECQPLLSRLDSDLLKVMLACIDGTLDKEEIHWNPQTGICVVMAARGYPGQYPKGMEITGLDVVKKHKMVTVFQAGTQQKDQKIVTTGGRVLGVTALGEDLAAAKELAYKAIEDIHFDNSYIRRDIGDKGLKD